MGKILSHIKKYDILLLIGNIKRQWNIIVIQNKTYTINIGENSLINNVNMPDYCQEYHILKDRIVHKTF